MKNKKTVIVNLAREMIKAAEIDFQNGNHKSIVSIDFIEDLMHKYYDVKVKNLNIDDVNKPFYCETKRVCIE